jgi:hypothetical protein
MKYRLLTIVLFFSFIATGFQAGRVRRDETPEKSSSNAELPLKLDSSRPVLVNMSPEDFKASGLNKLSEAELDHLDHWVVELLVKLQSLPKGQTLKFEKSGEDSLSNQREELRRQELETQVRDLQQRLASVRQEAARMSFEVSQARLAASRGDWGGLQNSLFGLESSVSRVQQASQ